MFKSGDFSRLGRVSVKTLHHYDNVGLLKPAHTDPWTGYRFYRADQLPRLNQIFQHQDLGFALDEIATLLDSNIPTRQFAQLLRDKHAELQQHVQAEQARLARLEVRLPMIEEDAMPQYDVLLKQVEPHSIVSGRSSIASPEHTLVYRDGAVFAEGIWST
jgi:DNA-binding transcriptional MerR regulator